MESHLASAKDDKVDVSLTAIELYSNSDAARVHIALDWPWNSLKGNSKTVGVFGIVLKKDGTLATRFSDLAGFNSTDEDSSGPHWDHIWTRYEMQLTLTPGEYDLRAVVSDGTRFGLAEIPLTVDSYDTRELAISALSLCKQVSEASAYSSKNQPRLPGTWTAKLPGNYVPLVSNDMEFKPTAHTRFKKGDTLYTYFEVYEPLLKAETPPTVQIQIRVADLKTGEVESDSQPISATPYVKPGSTVIPIGRGIDISKLPTGSYRLDVRATDSAGKTTVWRSANFTVD
jgi:hypothetical protein